MHEHLTVTHRELRTEPNRIGCCATICYKLCDQKWIWMHFFVACAFVKGTALYFMRRHVGNGRTCGEVDGHEH